MGERERERKSGDRRRVIPRRSSEGRGNSRKRERQIDREKREPWSLVHLTVF